MLKTLVVLVAISVGAALLWRASSLGAGELATHPSLDRPSVQSAVRHLRTAQRSSDMETLTARIADAVDALGETHFATAMLSSAEAEAQADIDLLREKLGRVIGSLTFRPWVEASLPEGFPEFTPVHHIEVKTLPNYRMARGSMPSTQRRGENGAFWKLFSHIKRNDIAMTAPIQMDYTSSGEDAEVASMAFLYGSRRIGEPGKDAAAEEVETVDIPTQDVLTIGVRGRMSADSLKRGHQALLEWLNDQDDYRPSGPLRRLGYNSPFISADRAFFELQIPVEKVELQKLAEPQS